MMHFLLELGEGADSKDGHGWTPLSKTAGAGQEAIVKLLVKRDDVETDSMD